MKKKILILTASYGTGHITAAKAINEAFNKNFPEYETKIIDFLQFRKQQSQLTFFQKLYNFSMEKPILFDIFFFVTNNRVCVSLLKKIILLSSYKKFKNLFDEYQPDIIISTHPYWNFIVKRYKKQTQKNIPYLCVITDSYMIHQSWIDSSVDYYLVIDEDTKHLLINNGISKIYVTGFPVNSKLFEKVDKEKILAELGLKPNKLTILIVVGLGAIERFIEIIEFLKNKTEDFQMIIVAGKYQNVYGMYNKMNFVPKTKLIGWTDRMYDFIRVSDLVISKGGGAIVSESLSAKVPIFIPVFVPGQERGNVFVIKKYQMGFHEIDINKIYNLLNKIISKEINLDEYKSNIERWIKHDPAYKIASLVNKILSNKIC
jgi:processive 1,2-diacylglycerol beta-glucosyltransferase